MIKKIKNIKDLINETLEELKSHII